MAFPDKIVNFFSEILLIPGISIASECSQDFFPGVKINGSVFPSVIRSSDPLKTPADVGISRNASEENQESGISVTASTTCICISIGSPHTFGDAERIIFIFGFSMMDIS
jgi:hypothetical protein